MDAGRRKKKVRRARKAAVGPFDVWINRTITANYTWNDGDEYLKGNPPPGKFRLTPLGTGTNPTEFLVEVKDQELPDYWKKSVILRGKDKLAPPAAKLPKLTKLNLADMLIEVGPAIKKLNVNTTKLKRLEGMIEVPDPGGGPPTQVQVRMVLLAGVMDPENTGDPMRDFVVILFRNPKGGPDPNGGGSGPPD